VGEAPDKDFLTPMDWCCVAGELAPVRLMEVDTDVIRMQRWLDRHPDAVLYNILSHDPIEEWDGLESALKGDALYETQLVRTEEGIYADDYGLRVFCTTRLSPVFREDVDTRNDRHDYLCENIRSLPELQGVG
jgi:hypothetical protein